MSWRRFLVLLRGLSVDSLLAMSTENNDTQQEEFESDEKAEQALYNMLGVRK